MTDKSSPPFATGERSLVEQLRSRAWEDRQHRELRSRAADRIEELERELHATNLLLAAAEHTVLSAPSEIAQFEEAKKAIAWANNSLYGSHGYFLSDCGGPTNEHHLDAPIENLKADCNRWYRAASPYATPEALAEALSALSATPQKPPRDPNVKYPRLFYWEDAEDCWCPAEELEVENIISAGVFLADGEISEVRFKRMDMTDAEYDAIPEG